MDDGETRTSEERRGPDRRPDGPRGEERKSAAVRQAIRSELAVPLEVNGEVRGVLNVDSDRLDAFTADDQELLEALKELALAQFGPDGIHAPHTELDALNALQEQRETPMSVIHLENLVTLARDDAMEARIGRDQFAEK